MKQAGFFYSTNGTDVHGPFADDELPTLIRERRIGPGSFLCRAGESTWVQLNLPAPRAAVIEPEPPAQPAPEPELFREPDPEPEPEPLRQPPPLPVPPPIEVEPVRFKSITPSENFGGSRVHAPEEFAEPARGRPRNDLPEELALEYPDEQPQTPSYEDVYTPPEESAPEPVRHHRVEEPEIEAEPEPPSADENGEATPSRPPIQWIDSTVYANEDAPEAEGTVAEPEPPAQESTAEREARLLKLVLTVSAIVSALTVAAIAAIAVRSSSDDLASTWPVRLLVFGGILFVITGVPWVLSLLRGGIERLVIRAAGTVALAFLVSIVVWARPELLPVDSLRAGLASLENRLGGLFASKPAPAPPMPAAGAPSLGHVSVVLRDDADRARVGRDLTSVVADLDARIKLCEEQEAADQVTLDATTTSDRLAVLASKMKVLRSAQNEVVAALVDYDTHCHAALAPDHVSPEEEESIVATSHRGGHIDDLLQLWRQKSKVTDDQYARLDFLQQTWGQWQVKNGKIAFDDAAVTLIDSAVAPSESASVSYAKLDAVLNADLDRLHDIEKQQPQ